MGGHDEGLLTHGHATLSAGFRNPSPLGHNGRASPLRRSLPPSPGAPSESVLAFEILVSC
jgi:hypothetical protein